MRLAACAPGLNPVESMWAGLKRSLGNLSADTVDDLATTIKSQPKSMQYRPP